MSQQTKPQSTPKVEFVLRREGQGTYGLGETVIPGVTLFRAGNYNLTRDEVKQAIRKNRAWSVSRSV